MGNVKYVTGLNLVITQLCAMGKRPKFHSFKVAKNLSRFVGHLAFKSPKKKNGGILTNVALSRAIC